MRVERNGVGLWLRIARNTYACLHSNGGFFRVHGYGLRLLNHQGKTPFASERFAGRNGMPRKLFVHVGQWCITSLKPWR